MAQKIHLSRVVSAVKDELRPRKWFIGRLALLLCTKWLQFLFEFFFSKAKSNFARKSRRCVNREFCCIIFLLLLLQIVFKVTNKIALYLIGGLLWNLPADNRASGKDLELVQCMQFRAQALLRRKLRCTMPSPTSLVDWFHGPVA